MLIRFSLVRLGKRWSVILQAKLTYLCTYLFLLGWIADSIENQVVSVVAKVVSRLSYISENFIYYL